MSEYYDEQTMFKVLRALVASGLTEDQANEGIREMQNAGILFRERGPSLEKDQRPHSRACGFKRHPHGPECSKNCPTCYGQ